MSSPVGRPWIYQWRFARRAANDRRGLPDFLPWATDLAISNRSMKVLPDS